MTDHHYIQKLREEVTELYYHHQYLNHTSDKDLLRESHLKAKTNNDSVALNEALKRFKKLQSYFKEPYQIKISRIKPKLINIDDDSLFKSLYKITRHTWSMPFNKGYGRRLRYVVYDEFHDSVIGIIGLQSPPADLACRDDLFDFSNVNKLDMINQTMDIYSLGSIPPYSALLGGKLVAGLAASKKIIEDYKIKYANTETLIENKVLQNELVALTTTSAFGKSSIYNRLKYKSHLIAEPIGYTKGYGNLHLEQVYPKLIELLKQNNLYTAGGYGNGPKQRWQNITKALQLLGLPNRYSKHGVQREVYLYRLRENLEQGMAGKRFGKITAISSSQYSEYWLERWAKARAQRNPDWQNISTENYILNALSNGVNSSR